MTDQEYDAQQQAIASAKKLAVIGALSSLVYDLTVTANEYADTPSLHAAAMGMVAKAQAALDAAI